MPFLMKECKIDICIHRFLQIQKLPGLSFFLRVIRYFLKEKICTIFQKYSKRQRLFYFDKIILHSETSVLNPSRNLCCLILFKLVKKYLSLVYRLGQIVPSKTGNVSLVGSGKNAILYCHGQRTVIWLCFVLKTFLRSHIFQGQKKYTSP